MGFLGYLFREVVVETDKSLRMILFFQPPLPQAPLKHGLEENSEESTIRESRGRIRMKCCFPQDSCYSGEVPSAEFSI
jgi:hypothetical protein